MATGVGSGDDRRSVLLIGGSGRIGTAVAAHLIRAEQKLPLRIVLSGRSARRGREAIEEVVDDVGGWTTLQRSGHHVEFKRLDLRDESALLETFARTNYSAVVHTAGPFDNVPEVLRAAIQAKVPAYCDVADPMEYIEDALKLGPKAKSAGTLALVAAGAFPGMSNLLALEGRDALRDRSVQNLSFNYFTAGLGGSGNINLLITNLGFGDPVCCVKNGEECRELVAGGQAEVVDFGKGIGRVNTWSWPFPEGLTVSRHLGIQGSSRVAMGTAPEIWNVIMSGMTDLLPRSLWRDATFSGGLARFSEPLVAFTDKFVGETHAIRVDISSVQGLSPL